jgi:hypothetical protein
MCALTAPAAGTVADTVTAAVRRPDAVRAPKHHLRKPDATPAAP